MAKKRRSKRQVLTDHLLFLDKSQVLEFFKSHELEAKDTKKELHTAVRKAFSNGEITIEDIVAYLDEVTPWGKQHVLFYEGPDSKDWRDETWVQTHLKNLGLDSLLNAKPETLILPEKLTLSSIEWDKRRLRLIAVRRREGWTRDDDYDEDSTSEYGEPIKLRAFVHQTIRGITTFEWNLVSGEAFLQVTQLPTTGSYEGVVSEFIDEVHACLDITKFTPVKFDGLIKTLLEKEENGKPVLESHNVDYGRVGKRRISLRSESTKVPLRGDTILDGVMKTVRKNNSIPRIAGFYYPPIPKASKRKNANSSNGKLIRRTSVIVVATKRRINFATASTEKEFRDVLAKLRANCT